MEMEMDSNHINYNQSNISPDRPSAPAGVAEGQQKYVVHTGKDYDFRAHRDIEKPTNNIESVGHLIKGCLGGGIMGIHEAYMKCGLLTALGVNVAFGLYVTYCMNVLVQAAQILCVRLHIPSMSFPDVAEASLIAGPFPKLRKYSTLFRYAVDVTICLDLFGSCCVYEVIIAKTLLQLINKTNDEPKLSDVRMYVLALLIPIILLCMITSLKYLAPFSLVADFFIVVCVIATVYYGLQVAPPIGDRPNWKSFTSFFEFCGVVVFSMEGVGVCLPIENNMLKPMQFPRVLVGGMTVVVGFVMTVGFFGYWGFGESSQSPVTLNFPQHTFPTILKALMGVMIFITFALNFWAPFNLVWYYRKKYHHPDKWWLWERIYRTITILIITAVAVAFPNVGNLMGFLGSFCLSNMGFIFPAFIETVVCWEDPGLGPGRWILWKNVAIAVLGVLLMIAGTYSNCKGLLASL